MKTPATVVAGVRYAACAASAFSLTLFAPLGRRKQ